MKLGVALNERARLAKGVSEKRDLLDGNLTIQEGEEVLADPNALIYTAMAEIDEISALVAAINKTNAETTLPDGRSLTQALADRDRLSAKIAFFDFIIRQLSVNTPFPFRRSSTELKQIRLIKLTDMVSERDAFAKEKRELDTELQQINWTVDLVE